MWDDLSIQVWTLGVSKVGPVESAIGNDTEVISKKQVSLPLGPATLVLVKRTPPATEETSGSARSTLEYWLMVFRPYPQRTDMELAYTLHAGFGGSRQHAESELLSLARGWKLP